MFKSRARAFEAVYFSKLDAELIEQLHCKRKAARDRRELARATGISDEILLGKILELGVSANNLEALSLAPLICVAWANGSLDPNERKAALNAIMAEEIVEGSPSYLHFETLLSHAPDSKLMDTWRDYVATLLSHLDVRAREQIRESLLARAKQIASASGGIMGVGSISMLEREVIDEIESAMT
jgi:hypothetical protein